MSSRGSLKSSTSTPATGAPATLPSLLGVRVLVVGDLMADRYWYGSANRVSQEAPVPVVDVSRTELQPGGAANTALNVVALGARCTLVGAVGDDEAGRELVQRLTAAGVDCDLVVVPNWSTIVKLRIVSQQQQLLRADFESPFPEQGAAQSGEPTLAEQLLERVQQQLTAPAAVPVKAMVLQDYDKGVVADPPQFIAAAQAANVPVVVDPKFKPLGVYAGATLLKPNVHEFRRAVGDWRDNDEMVSKAEALVQAHSLGALIITRGDQGMRVISQTGEHANIPARPVDVFDVTGAGDTAAAALAITQGLGWSAAACAEVANAASGIAVTRSGTAAVTGPELSAALSGAHGGDAGILSRNQLIEAVARAKKAGQRVVFTNGCFDILHAGHVSYLGEAAALGDKLVVAVNDDASVTRLKGVGRPLNPLDRRLKVLAGLGAVDWVVGFAEDTPEQLLELLHPDVLVKGGDYGPDTVVGAAIVHAYGGEVAVLSLVDDCSTTAIVERIQGDAKP